jgi:UDP-glucuronate 4-epimerase
MKILITGVAGFIGMHVAKRLLESGHAVTGLDNLNAYYDVRLKHYRIGELHENEKFNFFKIDLRDRVSVARLFDDERYDVVIHLAAQAGVRYSLEAPFDYVDSNLAGFMAILEGVRAHGCKHLIYASSSSVYGENSRVPFEEEERADEPLSLYAATKRSNELMAYSYANLYKIPISALRFFTVYGPAGRPDMAPWLFTEAILSNHPIQIFNNGEMYRDFTYIDDIVDGIEQVMGVPPSGSNTHRILNIGRGSPVSLMDFIATIEDVTGRKAIKVFTEMHCGDVTKTYASTKKLTALTGYSAKINIPEGVIDFVNWYRDIWKPYELSSEDILNVENSQNAKARTEEMVEPYVNY